ncbi:MAG: rubredoxin [Bacteroidales bacterium]|nr:rubredoxin [Bacteroidales bacterium]
MKYKCRICGYLYDEEVEKVKFTDLPDDWRCPVCKASKSDFAPENEPMASPEAVAENSIPSPTEHGELRELSYGQLAAICSNLARGCEKQYMFEQQAKFLELAGYFDSISPESDKSEISDLMEIISKNLTQDYPNLDAAGTVAKDRGALRVKVWGEKVTMIQKSLLERYLRDGDDAFAKNSLWICTICGFIYMGDKAPQICPVCKVPDWKFEKVMEG